MKTRVKIIISLAIFGVVALAIAIAATLFSFRAYQAFNKEALVGAVVCERVSRYSQEYWLTYTPLQKRDRPTSTTFVIKGEQWTFGGDMLKWSPYLNIFGLHTLHKPTRIAGRYLTEADEKERPRTVYDINGGTDRRWLFLYRYGRFIPFVEAVYGNSAYVFCEDNAKFNIYVTTSGYIIKKAKDK